MGRRHLDGGRVAPALELVRRPLHWGFNAGPGRGPKLLGRRRQPNSAVERSCADQRSCLPADRGDGDRRGRPVTGPACCPTGRRDPEGWRGFVAFSTGVGEQRLGWFPAELLRRGLPGLGGPGQQLQKGPRKRHDEMRPNRAQGTWVSPLGQ